VADDIGGFEGKPDPGLYKRWLAFGCLSSHSRLHGSGSYRVCISLQLSLLDIVHRELFTLGSMDR